MAKKKEIIFRRLKKNRLAFSLLMLILTTFAAHLLLVAFVLTFTVHLVEQKVQTAYERVLDMAGLYEESTGRDDGEFLDYLNRNAVYFVEDANGKVIAENGVNTCVKDAYIPFRMHDEQNEVTVYSDEELSPVNDLFRNEVYRTPWRFMLLLGQKDKEVKQQVRTLTERESEKIEIPVWLAAKVSEQETLFGKTCLEIEPRDLMLLSIFALSIAFLIFVVLIIMLANIIKGVVRQRKMTNVFFMDEVTEQQNWMWFHMKGNALLSTKKNASKQFAILDVVFMNYRNFCVCHSVEEGEEMLKKVHTLINNSMQKKEMCAHYASANFAVLLQYKAQSELKNRVEKLIRELEGIDQTHKFSFHVGVDLLEVSLDDNGRVVRRKDADVEKEYNNACAARATLSEQEDSAVAYFNEQLVEEQRWMDIVRENQSKALENEEFAVFYQPKYDPKTKRLCGAEALIRWNSSEFGFVSPGKFIPIFEKNGFITEIDHYMLKHVAKDQRTWLDKGYACVPVSVNVSRAHFIESDLAEQIRDIVDAENCPHDLIELELTESAFFDDKNALIETIRRLKGYGFSVSMDDFGSGYSSLNSLKDMPLDVLKLDAEFFRGDGENDRAQIVVSEAIRLAKNLNMRTVAEGVEVKEQVDFLADLGCDMIQGFYFAKPMPKEDYVKRMQGEDGETSKEQEASVEKTES